MLAAERLISSDAHFKLEHSKVKDHLATKHHDDYDSALAEVQRTATEGGRSLQLPVFPTEVGLPDYFDR